MTVAVASQSNNLLGSSGDPTTCQQYLLSETMTLIATRKTRTHAKTRQQEACTKNCHRQAGGKREEQEQQNIQIQQRTYAKQNKLGHYGTKVIFVNCILYMAGSGHLK